MASTRVATWLATAEEPWVYQKDMPDAWFAVMLVWFAIVVLLGLVLLAKRVRRRRQSPPGVSTDPPSGT